MGKVGGFMEYKRVDESYDTVENRLKNYKAVSYTHLRAHET